MGEFIFKTDRPSQLCIKSGDGFYQVQRKMEEGYANFAIDGKTLQVNARSNLCVMIPFAGEYRIAWKDPINCVSSEPPSFEVNALDLSVDRNTTSDWTQVGCYTDPVTKIRTPVFIHTIDDFNGAPQFRIINLNGDIVAGADTTNTRIGNCDCPPVMAHTFKTQSNVTLPAGLKSISVRNKGAPSIYVAGKELCGSSAVLASPCGNCSGESLTMDAGCSEYAQPINITILPSGCAEISIEWSPNPLLDRADSDGDGIPDWLEELNPCLTLPDPDVTVSDIAGNPVGMAYSFSSPCFDVLVQDLASNSSYYAASAPMLNKAYVAQQDLSGAVTHYLLAV